MSNKLSEKHPELIKEWSEKNSPLTADDVTFGSNKLYWWKGDCGHEWQASAKSRSSGEKCPVCSGARVIDGINDLQTLNPNIAAEWSDKNSPLFPAMVTIGSHKKAIWQCSKRHEWVATVKSRTINETGCPYCSHNAVLAGYNDLATTFPNVAAEWSDRNLPLRPNMVTAFANKKVWWRCSKGHEWNTLISTRSGGSQCPYCSGIQLLKGFNDLQTTHPKLALEWSIKNGSLSPDTVNEKSIKMVWWKCGVCGYEWRSQIKSRVKGSKCPVCSEREVYTGYNDIATTDPIIASEWDREKNIKLNPMKINRNSLYCVWWKCPHGHSWKARVVDRTIKGKKCSQCEKEYQSVFPAFLISMYAAQNDCHAILNSDKQIGLPIDVYIPELRLAIDYSKSTNRKERNAQEIKEHICSKNGIKYCRQPYSSNEMVYAYDIKNLFRQEHVLIASDVKKDITNIREKFVSWRRSIEM